MTEAAKKYRLWNELVAKSKRTKFYGKRHSHKRVEIPTAEKVFPNGK